MKKISPTVAEPESTPEPDVVKMECDLSQVTLKRKFF